MTLVIHKNNAELFRQFLANEGYAFEARPYQYFLARKPGLTINFYQSGKIVLAGKAEDEIEKVKTFLFSLEAREHVKQDKEYASIRITGTRIGTDEAGKGDYFGPLVVAGVLATESQIETLQALGIKDSKRLVDNSIRSAAAKIKAQLPRKQYDLLAISPQRYNSLYKEMGNLNSLLGWAHARVIENLLEKNPGCNQAVADQFGDRSYIEKALLRRGQQIMLIQVPKGEREITVAAASILARESFLQHLTEMAQEFGMEFPKGATRVIEAAKQFVNTHGEAALGKVAKLHFKTTRAVRTDN